MIEAAPALTTDKSVRLFEKFGIFTKVELLSREEIIYETYAKTINIEALTMIDMAAKQIIHRRGTGGTRRAAGTGRAGGKDRTGERAGVLLQGQSYSRDGRAPLAL